LSSRAKRLPAEGGIQEKIEFSKPQSKCGFGASILQQSRNFKKKLAEGGRNHQQGAFMKSLKPL
jgi:hypothetical protein